jgi:hypothetical protein
LSTHTASLVAEPAALWVWAAVHTVHALQVLALVCVLNVPALQAAHCRSVVVVGSAVCLLPGWHAVSALHFRSDSAVAGVDSYWLALQTVSGWHASFT